MSYDKLQIAVHEAGHAILALLTGKAQVHQIYVERRLAEEQWEGHSGVSWDEKADVAIEDPVGVVYGGPCAELKYLANLNSDELWNFDLDDGSAEDFLYPYADDLITVRFRTKDGNTKEITVDPLAFITDRELAQQYSDDEKFHIFQYQRVRGLLNVESNWSAVKQLGVAIAEVPLVQITRSELWGTEITAALSRTFRDTLPHAARDFIDHNALLNPEWL